MIRPVDRRQYRDVLQTARTRCRLSQVRCPFLILAVLSHGAMVGLVSCSAQQPDTPAPPTSPRSGRVPTVSAPTPPPSVASITNEPAIRVRMLARVETVSIRSRGSILVGLPSDQRHAARPRRMTPPITLSRRSRAFLLTDGRGRTLKWAVPAVQAEPTDAGTIEVAGSAFSSPLIFAPSPRQQSLAADHMDVINHVLLEEYIAGVVEKELYSSWHPAAFRAQAIAARSYALWERALHSGRDYDLEATTASQAYGGLARQPRVLDAVRRTRGQVLSFGGSVLPAFYSSCSGGSGQDGFLAFPGRVADLPPLRGREYGWGRRSPHYRWGPIKRDVATLSKRISTWGGEQRHPVAQMQMLRDVQVTGRSRTGRPSTFTLTDRRGRRFEMAAESFRFACNQALGDGRPLNRSAELKSSHVQVKVLGGAVWFTHGRGFGHGVGLCQWSAQEMAMSGYSEYAILRFFYPASHVRRLY